MEKIKMLHLYHNEWSEERLVCDRCHTHMGKGEVERDLNQGFTDDRDMFRYSRPGFMRKECSCTVCDSPFDWKLTNFFRCSECEQSNEYSSYCLPESPHCPYCGKSGLHRQVLVDGHYLIDYDPQKHIS